MYLASEWEHNGVSCFSSCKDSLPAIQPQIGSHSNLIVCMIVAEHELVMVQKLHGTMQEHQSHDKAKTFCSDLLLRILLGIYFTGSKASSNRLFNQFFLHFFLR